MKPFRFANFFNGFRSRNLGKTRGKRGSQAPIESIERLEERALLAVVSWNTDASGFWDDGNNWSTGQIPGSGDDVTIDRGAFNPIITIRDNRTVNSIISRESLVVTNGTFQINSASQIDASTTTLTEGAAFVANGAVTITNTGNFDWQGGGIFGSGLANSGTITVSAATDVRLGGLLNNNGTIVHSGAGDVLLDGSTILNNNAGAVYNLTGDGDFGRSGFGAGFISFFQNAGTLRKSAGVGVSEFIVLTLNNSATGVFDVQSGRLNAGSSGDWVGAAFTGAAGGVFEISGSYTTTGTLTGTGSGQLELTGSIVSSGSDAKFNFPAGYFQWTNGVISGPGAGFTNLGTITLSGSNDVRLGGQLINNGTFVHSSDNALLFDGSSKLVNSPGSLYNLTSDGDLGRSAFGAGFSPFFQNDGTLRKSAGTGSSTVSVIAMNGSATGVFDVLTGRFVVTQVSSWTGSTLNAATGAVLEVAANITLEGTLTGSGGGRVELASGAFITTFAGATLNFPAGLLHWTGGGIFTNAPLINTGTLQISGNTDKSVGAVIVNDGTVIHMGSGDIIDVASGQGSRFENHAGALYEFQGDDSHATFSTFNNAGTVRKTSGAGESRFFARNGDPNGFVFFNNLGGTIEALTGTLRLARGSSTGGTYNASAGAVLDITGGGNVSVEGTYQGTGGGRVELAGGNVATTGAGATFDFPAGMFHWSGGGVSGNNGGFRNNGSIIIDGASGKGLSGSNFINNGTMVNIGSGEFGLGGHVFTNSVTGVFDQQGDSPLNGTDQFNNPGRFINAGLFKKSSGAGAVSWNARLENAATGVMEVSAGTMGFSRGGSSTGGTFHVSVGSVLEFTGGDVFDWTGNFTGTGLGDIEIESLLRGGEGQSPGVLNFPEGMFHMLSGQLLGNIVNNGWFDFAPTTGLFTRAGITNNGTFIHSGAGDFVLNANSQFVNNGLYDLRTDADLVVPGDASGGTMNFFNKSTGVFRKSAGLGTSSFRHDGNGKSLRFDNAGTVEVQFGTVEFGDNAAQFSGTTLTGGTWIVRQFSAITAPNASNFTTNSGHVTLDGLGSSFARIDTIASNRGSFSLLNGRDFTTVGNLTNSGELTVGPASELNVNGNLTESPLASLVGWWRGDDNATSSVGAINGTLNGNTTFDEGEFGHAFRFDGNRDFVSLGNPAALQLQNFTISAWVQRDTATQSLIFGYGQSGYGFGVFADGKLFLTQIGVSHVQTSTLQLNDNEFHHLAVTKSGSNVTFYIDGVAEVAPPYSPTFSFFSNAAIGARADATGADFDGRIDEVAVFNRPLTATEIQGLGDNNNPTVLDILYPALNIQVGDRPGTGQFGQINVTGAANLTGEFNVDLVNGFGPILPDAYTVLTYASRTGSFFPVSGIEPFFDIAINPTQTVLTVVASAADLAVQDIDVPASASPGDVVNIQYTVQNLDNINVAGSWFDSIYLSSDNLYDPDDVLIGRVEHTGGLAPLASYVGSLTAQLPGVVDGNYRVIVIADSRGNVGDSNRTNNTLASTEVISVDLPVLAFDTLTPLTIDTNEDIYLRLNVPFGGDVLVTATFPNSLQSEFFIRQGALPTRSEFDYVASDLTDLSRTITLASPDGGAYYILFHGREGAAGGVTFNVLAENIEFDLQTVSPSRGSNQGRATTVLTGAGFTEDTVVELLNGSGDPVAAATSTHFINPNRLYATFDLVGVAATFEAHDPKGYGRIVHGTKGFQIVEEKDADEFEKNIKENRRDL